MTNWLASIESRPVGHQDLRVQHGLFQGRLEHVKQVWTGTTWGLPSEQNDSERIIH